MTRKWDIVVYGATGFTGQLLAEFLDQSDHGLKVAIAGRNKAKLESLSSRLKGQPEVIVADAFDKSALTKLAKSTKVVVTTAGPYAKYGSDLVHACAESGTHYCDLTGEVQWIHKMIAETDQKARDTGSRIVHCCGFDSIPSDMGTHLLQTEFHKKYGSPATRVKFGLVAAKGGFSGGTAASLLNVMEQASTDRRIARVLGNPCSLNAEGRTWKTKGEDPGGYYDEDLGWLAPFLMAPINTRIVRRSASLMPEVYGDELQYQEYSALGKGAGRAVMANTMKLGFGASYLAMKSSVGRKVFAKLLPEPGEGPDQEKRDSGFFKIKLVADDDQEQKLSLVVRGKGDPGYASTSKMLGTAAIHLAKEMWRESHEAGNKTTAYVFDQRFRDALDKVGVSFKVEG